MDHIMQRKILKHIEECHKSAMAAIELISNVGINAMNEAGHQMDPNNFKWQDVAAYAARSLELNETAISDEYMDLLLLEKMIEYVGV
ncbi:hypothetical protein [Gorillibacterium sp. sgz5001074]|uniref:hypothetical protein n=1 Tax=Gorillibacterium sp. sgz5001074 TaxID=3446695 RepID=UPI003F675BE5